MAAENENLLLRAHGVHITTKQVILHCRKDAKCTKMTNVCAKPTKVLFFVIKYAKFLCCCSHRSHGCFNKLPNNSFDFVSVYLLSLCRRALL